MKLLFVFDGLGTGGIESVGINYINELVAEGIDVSVINLMPGANTNKKRLPKKVIYKELHYSKFLTVEQYTQLYKKSSAIRFLVPPLQLVLLCFEKIAGLFSRSFIFRDTYDATIAFSGHFNDLTFIAEKFVKGKKRFAWVHGALYSYLLLSPGYLNLYKQISNINTLVSEGNEEVLAYEKFPSLNINQIYNPIISNNNVNQENVKLLKQRFGKFILVVDRFDYPYKDHYTIIKAFVRANKSNPEISSLVLVGDGPDFEKVRDWVSKEYPLLVSHVHFEGNQDNVGDYYSAAYMLVHACAAGEGLPTVMLEAMEYGLPILATDAKVGAKDILQDESCGLLCTVNDSEDMSKKIRLIYSDYDLVAKFKQCQRQRINDFQPKNIISKLKKIIEAKMEGE